MRYSYMYKYNNTLGGYVKISLTVSNLPNSAGEVQIAALPSGYGTQGQIAQTIVSSDGTSAILVIVYTTGEVKIRNYSSTPANGDFFAFLPALFYIIN